MVKSALDVSLVLAVRTQPVFVCQAWLKFPPPALSPPAAPPLNSNCPTPPAGFSPLTTFEARAVCW